MLIGKGIQVNYPAVRRYRSELTGQLKRMDRLVILSKFKTCDSMIYPGFRLCILCFSCMFKRFKGLRMAVKQPERKSPLIPCGRIFRIKFKGLLICRNCLLVLSPFNLGIPKHYPYIYFTWTKLGSMDICGSSPVELILCHGYHPDTHPGIGIFRV
ncbi:MAG: hypothetical protein BWY05_01289 [Euryarchaeota archaeon ADurb.Bin165]|nr:MAG: hypothetical protein BWY05_01289 [Euryarchaeota archaeon ADurb.Bin165]